MRSLSLSIARSFEPQEADKAFRLLLNLSVRFLVAGGARSGSVEQAIASAARDISAKTITSAGALLDSLRKSVPKDLEFEEAFKGMTVSSAYLARYYLRSLELTVKGEPHPYFIPNDDQQVINLEHVLPENPKANWPQFAPDVVPVYSRRLGNLALLEAKANKALGSASFSDKKIVYAASPYELTSQIAAVYGDWGAADIAERQARMAKLAVTTWAVAV